MHIGADLPVSLNWLMLLPFGQIAGDEVDDLLLLSAAFALNNERLTKGEKGFA